MERGQSPIIFFDGVCTLCNGFVDFVIKRDPGRFQFASLQGETARKNLDAGFLDHDPKSIVLWDEAGVHTKSQAVIRILARLPAPWKLAVGLYAVPPGMRDFFYDFIAKRRYRWFGRRDTCRLPGPQERSRILA